MDPNQPSFFLDRMENGETSADLGYVLEAFLYTFMTTHKYLTYCITFIFSAIPSGM